MKTVLVIGGNSGVGAACVDAFAAKNWHVVATYHCNRKRIDERLEQLPSTAIEIHQLDVTDASAVSSLRDHLQKEEVTLTAVVHVASYNQPSLWNRPPLELPASELLECFKVEVGGLHNVVTTFVPIMSADAAVVAFSSASAIHGDPDTFAYNISKSAIDTYIRMLAKEYGSQVRFNCIAPDSLRTDWLTEWDVTPEQVAGFRVMQAGSKRIGQPREAADLALWLCSPESSYLNGQTVVLDGGAG